MENQHTQTPEIGAGEEMTWEEYAEAMERAASPVPKWHRAETFKTRTLNSRVPQRLLDAFESASLERGMNVSEGIRQLVSAWLRNPEALPIGLPPEYRNCQHYNNTGER